MDKTTLKLVLGACRADAPDGNDPFFAEALREVERDPELAAWFEEERRFDTLMVKTLGQIPAPTGLKEMILLNARSPGKPAVLAGTAPAPWKRPAATWLAAAAAVLLAFMLGRQTLPTTGSPLGVATSDSADGRLALQAIACTGRMPALQFVCFDASEVANWVTEKSAALHMGKLLDKPMPNMQMIGSSASEWDGKPVIMIALQKGERMAMLYLVRASDFPGVAGDGKIMEKDGWVSKTGRHGEHLYVLTTKGGRGNLDFPMPL